MEKVVDVFLAKTKLPNLQILQKFHQLESLARRIKKGIETMEGMEGNACIESQSDVTKMSVNLRPT
ncbi:hypothetical protein H5410_064397 [Solanum commersonii]|uniref:Uncharacterized protein n=1 Tax=Solanum commersonii TaxID=4109 RepID=A0A9J5W080_SOLCO|nr:hypothetical protein H5410_064397 [Solanum commersonii]